MSFVVFVVAHGAGGLRLGPGQAEVMGLGASAKAGGLGKQN